MQQEIDQIEGHFMVCGFGQVGRQVVENLQLRQMAVVVVGPHDWAHADGEAELPRIRGTPPTTGPFVGRRPTLSVRLVLASRRDCPAVPVAV
jgi:voltage-gated potassium channel Kch